ncbi:MAG: hemerythrin domain-containing protein [Deltaproteobacteria bacterium]|nr:hemerythrin domain-containing protein [Deltaproteobacteria bacterium]
MKYEKFINGLEKEHAMIEQAFKKLEPKIKNGNVSDIAYVLEILGQLKTILINHLKDEDNLFYPDMRQKAVELKQDALVPSLDVYIEDMKNVSKKVFDFFSRYDNENAISGDEKGFIKGMIEIRDSLVKRVMTEEKTLYYIYKAYHRI